jgi:predicted AAA+ superfamily ATPase
MINRIALPKVKQLARQFRLVAVVGPRQSGKTTLCKMAFPKKPYVSLENPDIRKYANEDPNGFLKQYPKGAILDEIQKVPDLFSYLQEIVDTNQTAGLFILSGSNNFMLQENITQSLAGRVGYLHLLPLSIEEIRNHELAIPSFEKMVFKGYYPELFNRKIAATLWYANYINTYIERDVRQIKNIANLTLFSRFVSLCAGRAGQVLNINSLCADCGIDNKTASSWLSILESSYIIYLLKPYFENFNKRIRKAPKLYFYDTGLLCNLLRIHAPEDVTNHAMKGAIFENNIIAELLKYQANHLLHDDLYYWQDKTGNEVDLIYSKEGTTHLLEIKAASTLHQDFWKNLDKFEAISNKKTTKIVYYNGLPQIRSNGVKIINWKDVGY